MSNATSSVSDDAAKQLHKKVARHIVPFIFIAYVVAFLDRINIGFAQSQMKGDLGFSDAVYGFGAGIFFLGYFAFEVPSNLLLEKIGARKTFMRIMICWGAFQHAQHSSSLLGSFTRCDSCWECSKQASFRESCCT